MLVRGGLAGADVHRLPCQVTALVVGESVVRVEDFVEPSPDSSEGARGQAAAVPQMAEARSLHGDQWLMELG